jgi:hypothetical protein
MRLGPRGDNQGMAKRLGFLSVLVALLLGPATPSRASTVRAVPVDTRGPAWYDRTFHERVLAAGDDGIRVPAGATVPAAVGLGYSGIRPGQWLISLDNEGVGFAWCTANYVFKKRTTFGLGTAGHCAARDALGAYSDVTAYVVPPLTSGKLPGIYHIGRFVLSRDNGVGDAFAMVAIYPQYHSWVNPTMPVWGGPTGIKRDASPTVVEHFGHGTAVGAGGTPRAGVAPIWTARGGRAFAWYGVGAPGDSGSAVNTVLQQAGGNFTHIVVYDGRRNNLVGEIPPGMLAGTTITRILEIASGWTLQLGSPVPL